MYIYIEIATWIVILSLLFCKESVSDIVQAKMSSRPILRCSTDIIASPALRSQWLDPHGTSISDGHAVHDPKRFFIDSKFSREWNLEILNVREDDEGNYTCRIFTPTAVNKIVKLVVVYSPKIQNNSANQVLPSGASVTLTCSFTGKPTPNIAWFFHRNAADRIDLKVGGGSLPLSSVSRHSSGVYECYADNGISPPHFANIVVDVNFAPEISVPYQHISQQVGADIFVTCIVSLRPITRLYWTGLGMNVALIDGAKYQTHISNLSANQRDTYALGMLIRQLDVPDYGDYNCVATNDFGQDAETVTIHQFQTGRIYFVSTPRDSVVEVGGSVQLDCIVTGLGDTDSVTWWTNAGSDPTDYRRVFTSILPAEYDADKYEIRGDYSLYVKAAKLVDGGSYVCDVTTQRNYTAQVIVIDGTVLCAMETPRQVDSGADVLMTCSLAYATDAPLHWRMEWWRGPERLSSMMKDTSTELKRAYSLKAYYPDDTGNYTCSVSSRAANYTASCTIEIIVMPSNHTRPPQQLRCDTLDNSQTPVIALAITLTLVVIAAIVIICCLGTRYKAMLSGSADFPVIPGPSADEHGHYSSGSSAAGMNGDRNHTEMKPLTQDNDSVKVVPANT